MKYHFTPQPGTASLLWAEALNLAGQDPDFHRRDLFDAIEAGNYPEWEISVQLLDEDDVLKYGFDLLDPTKFVPVEIAPLTPIGKLVLNQNPKNYFAETEQVMVSVRMHVAFGTESKKVQSGSHRSWNRFLRRSTPPRPSILVC